MRFYVVYQQLLHTSLLDKGPKWGQSCSWAYHDDRGIPIAWQPEVVIGTDEHRQCVPCFHSVLKEGGTHASPWVIVEGISDYCSTD